MNDITIFNYEESQVRAITHENGTPWFVAKDVCGVLGLNNVSKALIELDQDEKSYITMSNDSNYNSNLRIIGEAGLYNLIFKSRKPEAKKFKRWVTHEVLPSIRKIGNYSLEMPKTKVEAIKCWLKAEEEKEQLQIENKNQSETIEKNKPLVSFAETIAKTFDAIDMGQFAKLIKENGIGFGRNRLFEWLRVNKYLMSDNVPYQKFIDNGYFQVIESCYNTPYGEKLYVKTLVTGRGQIAIIERLKLVK